jgi:hypothetical protein
MSKFQARINELVAEAVRARARAGDDAAQQIWTDAIRRANREMPEAERTQRILDALREGS